MALKGITQTIFKHALCVFILADLYFSHSIGQAVLVPLK